MKSLSNQLLVLLIVSLSCIQVAYGQNRGTINNPILPGFNPDPCIVRVNDDYYIVTSTFEWFPGLPIYHSKDLVNWKQIGHVLDRQSQLNLTGINDSDGIFAPSITYHNGLYYVMYTIVQDGISWPLKGYPNYIVTAKDPAGPWSEPSYIDRLGFDPSLFIDDDGKAYVLYRDVDGRKGYPFSPGIGAHELDLKTLKPIGEPRLIYSGYKNESAEGPKMIKKDGYFYLFTAEGGTGYGHYQAVARSKSIWGTYERAPTVLYTSSKDPSLPIQKTGHGTLFSTPDGQWYTTHLGARPLKPLGDCPLGRETFLDKIAWEKNSWPILFDGTEISRLSVRAPDSSTVKKAVDPVFTDAFSKPTPNFRYEFLREPYNESWFSLKRKNGYLSLRGRNALGSRFEESLMAQRITSYNEQYETSVRFSPTSFKHEAGLTCYYDTKHYYALGFTYNEKTGKRVHLIKTDKQYREIESADIPANIGEVFLRVRILNDTLSFFYSIDKQIWKSIGGPQDFNILSDEKSEGFTGSMVGLYSQDIMYSDLWAEFDYFSKTTNLLRP